MPRTEQEILNDFEKLGYKIENYTDCFERKGLRLSISIPKYYEDDEQLEKEIIIYLEKKTYTCGDWFYGIECELNMQEHKLLTDLFECWGWF